MSIHHARAGEVIDVRPLDAKAPIGSETVTLAKTDRLQIIRLVMPAGKEIPSHRAPGELVVQCLEGRVGLRALGQTQELRAGQLLYLPPHEPHSISGIEDGSLLLTLLLPHIEEENEVQEASEESFPASDAPAWTGISS